LITVTAVSTGGGIVLLYVEVLALLTQYCADDKIEKNVMGGACSGDGGGERHV
jgi:hypothetical protein